MLGFRKYLIWLVYMLCGVGLLFYFSFRAVESERLFFEELLLSNNRDLSLLSARHLIGELKQLRMQMDGFARLVLKEDFVEEKLRDHLRFNVDGHRFIAGVRYRKKEQAEWVSFLNMTSSFVSADFFSADDGLIDRAMETKRPSFSSPHELRDEVFASLFVPVRDLRQNITAGIIEVRFSLNRLFEVAGSVSDESKRMVLLVDEKGRIVRPKPAGWTLSPEEYTQMKNNPLGSFSRMVFQDRELFSWCSFSVLEPVMAPSWFVLVVEDGTEYHKFSRRMSFNIYSLALFGLLCLLYLGKILFLRR